MKIDFDKHWAILPSAMAPILLAAERLYAGEAVSAAGVAANKPRINASKGGVAVIPIIGTLTNRPSWINELFGGGSYQDIGNWFDAAQADKGIGAIVFDVDSPGGTVDGLGELSQKIYDGRGSKRSYAVVNGMAASAAYYLGSSASQMIISPSSEVGSIGTVWMHQDVSQALEDFGVKATLVHAGKYKVEGNPFEPLGDEAKAEMQRVVDLYYGQFVGAVARNREVAQSVVKSQFGEGRMLEASRAVAVGMADRIGTMESVLAKLMPAADSTPARNVRQRMLDLRRRVAV